jgi:hypothetical protein
MDMNIVKEQVLASVKKAVEEIILPQLEIEVEKQIAAKADGVVEWVLAKIMEAIPGKIDDALIEGKKAAIKDAVKALLLAQAEKISDKV